jgi:hypothetical protein
MGPVVCTRTFAPVLGGSHVQLTAVWEIGPKLYEEMAMFGAGPDGGIVYSSFTSDGKSATGQRADVTDVHPEAIGFEAAMPAGRARMIYWPDDEGGFHWVVESRNRKGWHRFTEHHYVRVR